MARSIYISVVGAGKTGKTALLKTIPNHPSDKASYLIRARIAQVVSDTAIIIDELPDISHHWRPYLHAVVLTVTPQLGETEQAFITRAQEDYTNLNRHLNEKTKQPKEKSTHRIPIVVVLTKADLMSPVVVQRLQSHLKQKLVGNDSIFAISATQNPNKQIDVIFLKAAQLAKQESGYCYERPTNLKQRVSGAIAGFFIKTLSDIFRKNPLHVFFSEIRKAYRSRDTFNFLITVILAPLLMPLYAIFACLQLPFLPFFNAYMGWKYRAVEVIDESIERINNRDVIAAAIIVALTTLAVFCMFFTPIGFATLLSSIVGVAGFSGLSTTWLAVITGLSVLIVTASLYAIGNNLYDYVIDKSPAQLPALAEKPIEFVPASNAAGQMAAVSSAPSQQPAPETTESGLHTSTSVLSAVPAATDAALTTNDEAKRPLLQL